MAFQIPDEESRAWVQSNNGDVSGNLWSTFNVDLTQNEGKLQTTRTKLVTNDDDESALEEPFAFSYYNGKHYALTQDRVFVGGKAPSDSFSPDDDAGKPLNDIAPQYSDMERFDGRLFVSSGGATGDFQLFYKNSGAWSTTSYSSPTHQSPHLLKSYAERLYITDGYDKVISTDTDVSSLSTSGPNTLDLGLNGSSENDYSITMLEKGEQSLWIGVMAIDGNRGAVYRWDGENENTFQRQFFLDSEGVVAGVVRRNETAPTILDTEGRILKYNGAGFQEVARLPINGKLLRDATENNNDRFVHPNGMIEKDGNILILVRNEIGNSNFSLNGSTYERLPSGVWEFNSDYGLYHKYSVSDSQIGDTGTTNLTDYGQDRMAEAGALYSAKQNDDSSSDNGDLLIGAKYLTDASNTKYGIFTNDTKNNTQSLARFTTKDLFAASVKDMWQKVIPRHTSLEDGDRLIVKTRTEYREPIEAKINWLDDTRFTTTDDVSEANVGNEVIITAGNGAGDSAQIEEIDTSTNTTTITLNRDIIGTGSGSGRVRITNFTERQVVEGPDPMQYSSVTISEPGVKIQVKFEIVWTGEKEVYDFIVVHQKDVERQ